MGSTDRGFALECVAPCVCGSNKRVKWRRKLFFDSILKPFLASHSIAGLNKGINIFCINLLDFYRDRDEIPETNFGRKVLKTLAAYLGPLAPSQKVNTKVLIRLHHVRERKYILKEGQVITFVIGRVACFASKPFMKVESRVNKLAGCCSTHEIWLTRNQVKRQFDMISGAKFVTSEAQIAENPKKSRTIRPITSLNWSNLPHEIAAATKFT